MTLLEKIKQVAQERGMTLTELNNKAGFGTNVIYSWKSKTPSVDKIEAVADVLNVSTDYLLGRTNNISVNNQIDNEQFDDEVLTMARKVQDANPKERAKGLAILKTLFDDET